jgi:5-methylcytosine-specific restriction enzyme A
VTDVDVSAIDFAQPLSRDDYARMGVMAFQDFPKESQDRINETCVRRLPPQEWRRVTGAWIPRRDHFEWYVRRGRDPQKKHRPKIPSWMRAAVIERDGWVCQICGGPIPDGDLHIDHIRPVSRGGRNSLSNLQAAHSTCNLKKSDRWEAS